MAGISSHLPFRPAIDQRVSAAKKKSLPNIVRLAAKGKAI